MSDSDSQSERISASATAQAPSDAGLRRSGYSDNVEDEPRRRRAASRRRRGAQQRRLSDNRAAAADGPTSHRRRVTLCQCLLNTNESNGGLSAVEELNEFLRQVLFTEPTLEEILLHASLDDTATARRIRAVEIRAASIEIGPQQKRVHAHWVMKIVHNDLKLNVGRMQRIMQEITKRHTSFTSPFVSIQLLNAAPENYTLKEVFDADEESSSSE
jgi:hypothetical protein